jgi:hypothetical protein
VAYSADLCQGDGDCAGNEYCNSQGICIRNSGGGGGGQCGSLGDYCGPSANGLRCCPGYYCEGIGSAWAECVYAQAHCRNYQYANHCIGDARCSWDAARQQCIGG